MKSIILGGAGFIGTNLAIKLSKNPDEHITIVDKKEEFFTTLKKMKLKNVTFVVSNFDDKTNFDTLLAEQDTIYHMVSTTIPSTSNKKIPEELSANIIMTSRMMESAVQLGVSKVVFISSGGAVYGEESKSPLIEDTPTFPITSYGVQKITIEKLLYLYRYMYGIDYRVVRLSNPFGPYQRPSGGLGAVTTFTYKALKKEKIHVYGDGSVIRDFIYIDDVINAIINITYGDSSYRIFNVGSGQGLSITKLLGKVSEALDVQLDVVYEKSRKIDVPINFLNISRYEKEYGALNATSLLDGIRKTASYLKK